MSFKICAPLFIVILVSGSVNTTTEPRSLLFPPTSPTRCQLIYGIGIPLELESESMTTGYVLKAEYFLPTKVEEFRPTKLNPQPITKRDLTQNKTLCNSLLCKNNYSMIEETVFTNSDQYETMLKPLSKYRWAVYKGIEVVVEKIGFIGKVCMLRSICEVSQYPFHYESGILGELMHIIMTPSSSVDSLEDHKNYEYYRAEILGKSGAPCDRIFKECKISIIGYFSGVFNY